MQRLAGLRALVTGASAGIGEACARALAGEGATLVLAARRRERLERLAAEIPGSEPWELDVRDEEACARLLGSQSFDIVIANAGLGLGLEPLHKGDPADWKQMFDTNVHGVLHVARYGLPAMVARGRGDFVFLGSVAGRHVYPGGNVYCASKWAVRALYEATRLDVAGSGVRVTTVDPGMVATDFSSVRFRGDAERAKKVYQGMTPLTPADVADAVLFAVTRPRHVNVGELVLWPTDQASPTLVRRV